MRQKVDINAKYYVIVKYHGTDLDGNEEVTMGIYSWPNKVEASKMLERLEIVNQESSYTKIDYTIVNNNDFTTVK